MRNKTKEKEMLLAKPVKHQNLNMYIAELGPSLGEDTSTVFAAGAMDFSEGAMLRGALSILGVVIIIPP